MELRYLEIFIKTAKHLSFSKAANECNIAQSAVSRQIKLLEESLGEQLFVRSPKKVILTQKGKELYLTALNFTNALDHIFERSVLREIRIGTLEGVLGNFLLTVLINFLEKHKSNFSITENVPKKLIAGLMGGKYDMILTNENIQTDLISSIKLFNEHLSLISRDKIDIKNISKYRAIFYDQEDFLLKHLEPNLPEHFIFVNSIEAIKTLVKANKGIAVIPTHTIRKDEKICKEPFNASLGLSIYLSTLNYDFTPQNIREFLSIVKKYTS
jgi:DNA-binding transcriptional LysR family regulator